MSKMLIVLTMRMLKVMLRRMMFRLNMSLMDVSALMLRSFFLRMM